MKYLTTLKKFSFQDLTTTNYSTQSQPLRNQACS